MQEIADRAGVNKSLLHYYFKSKAELARAVWLRIALSFSPGVIDMLSSDLSLDEKIDQYVDSYHTILTRHPYLLSYIVSEGARRPEFMDDVLSSERRQMARRMMSKLRQQIDEQVKQKRMVRVSPEQFFITLAGSCLFPFAAGPMLTQILGLNPKGFTRLMEERRKQLPEFLKKALRR
jgi:AcrR family transcriptional regulator